ncbi:MAG: alanine racemase [Akkermansiaceae bacterium]|nr:alanine racemase [Akkermansiaceae bacterium]MCP5549836.1 alanine racemase [Akkermansiaceae bacterium]
MTEPDRQRRCWAEIDLDALRHNAAVCRRQAPPGAEVMAVVKADAYGHGLERVGPALADVVDVFGVANVREAERLHRALGETGAPTGRDIVVLGPALPAEREALVAGGHVACVSSAGEAAAYSEAAKAAGQTARLHLAVDTGMGRMGVLPGDFEAAVETLRTLRNVRFEGVASHFPSADEEPDFTRSQIAQFRRLVEIASSRAGVPRFRVHVANSAGLLGFSNELGFTTLARPGLALYGVSPLPEYPSELRPALSLRTRITLARDLPAGSTISYGRTHTLKHPARVATLGIGYGDGYPRRVSGRGADALVRGRRCPLLGRVTMDQVVIDISVLDGEAVGPGDEAVLIGAQGNESIPVTEIAEKAGAIPWEILTGITSRVERVYPPLSGT